jgi:hypothetical protein
MSQLSFTHSSIQDRARARVTAAISNQAGQYALMFAMILMIGILSFFYLVKSTEIHTKGYQLRKLEIERDRLVTARESESMGISRFKSLNEIENSVIASVMVRPGNIAYVKEDRGLAQLPK